MAGYRLIGLVAVVCEIMSTIYGSTQINRATLQQSQNRQVFTNYLLSESSVRSRTECNIICAKFQYCVAYTFVASDFTCRCHWTLLMTSGPNMTSQEAKTWNFVPSKENWTIIQRRRDGSVDFYRNWVDYVNGFGSYPDGEFWIGLETIYGLTSKGKWALRFDFEDWEGSCAFAVYTGFYLTNSSDFYRLMLDVGGYTGTAGDSFSAMRGMQFTTKDADHDLRANQNCAVAHPGAWWTKSCTDGHPNGVYSHTSTILHAQGIYWRAWRGYLYSLKFTEMKIKRIY